MTPKRGGSKMPMGRAAIVLVTAVVLVLALTSVAAARIDFYGGPTYGSTYAPYTETPTVNDTPHAPHVRGPAYVPYTVSDEPYAPYTAGPVVREIPPYAPYTAGPVVGDVGAYAPYTAGPVVPEEEPYAPYQLPR